MLTTEATSCSLKGDLDSSSLYLPQSTLAWFRSVLYLFREQLLGFQRTFLPGEIQSKFSVMNYSSQHCIHYQGHSWYSTSLSSAIPTWFLLSTTSTSAGPSGFPGVITQTLLPEKHDSLDTMTFSSQGRSTFHLPSRLGSVYQEALKHIPWEPHTSSLLPSYNSSPAFSWWWGSITPVKVMIPLLLFPGTANTKNPNA